MGPPLCRTQKRHFLVSRSRSRPIRREDSRNVFSAERRDFKTNIADQTLLSVMAVRMWSYLILVLTKCESLTVPFKYICNLIQYMEKHHESSGSRLCSTREVTLCQRFCKLNFLPPTLASKYLKEKLIPSWDTVKPNLPEIERRTHLFW